MIEERALGDIGGVGDLLDGDGFDAVLDSQRQRRMPQHPAGVVLLTLPAAELGHGHWRGLHRNYSLRNIAVTAKMGCVTSALRGYESSNMSANTCAWLSSTSLAAVMRVRRPLRCRRSRRRNASARSGSSSSSRYRRANSSRLSGSCEYHFRSSVELGRASWRGRVSGEGAGG